MDVGILLSGAALGSIYALVALGFVLLFKSTGVLNFAHGSFVMLGAYGGVTTISDLGLPFIAGLLLTTAVLAIAGVLVHRGIMRHIGDDAFFVAVLVTIGLELVIRAGVLTAYGPAERGRLIGLSDGAVSVLGTRIPVSHFVIAAITVVTIVGFMAFFRYSRLGLQMRAVADDRQSAASSGISVTRVDTASWAIAIALAGVGGVLYGHYTTSIGPGVAIIGLKAFPAALLGGLDSVGGALVGGFLIGFVEIFAATTWGAEWRDVVAFGAMFLVLLWRPTGLFGSPLLARA